MKQDVIIILRVDSEYDQTYHTILVEDTITFEGALQKAMKWAVDNNNYADYKDVHLSAWLWGQINIGSKGRDYGTFIVLKGDD